MQFPPILAHGALGAFDELIYLGIAAIFVVIMVISWLRSRNAVVEEHRSEPTSDAPQSSEHFKLD